LRLRGPRAGGLRPPIGRHEGRARSPNPRGYCKPGCSRSGAGPPGTAEEDAAVSKFAGMLGLVTALGLWCAAVAEEKGGAGRTAGLVNQLGSQSFAEREQATSALDALGPAALDALRQAARHDSLEVR